MSARNWEAPLYFRVIADVQDRVREGHFLLSTCTLPVREHDAQKSFIILHLTVQGYFICLLLALFGLLLLEEEKG